MATHSHRRGISRRAFLGTMAAAGFAFGDVRISSATQAGEVLYNGIRLGAPWPPERRLLPAAPEMPPYLLEPPEVIPIDVGRQLFVDDFLVEATTLTRTFHAAEYASGNPVLYPTTPWERFDDAANRTNRRSNPTAMVFSDGVFFDPADRLYKIWYMGGYNGKTCYAYSHDGLKWEKPLLDVKEGTNIVVNSLLRDSSTTWLDLFEQDPARRFKLAMFHEYTLTLFSSPDGIHWREEGESNVTGDRTTFFYNPFRRRWVYSIRDDWRDPVTNRRARVRRYWEHSDFVAGTRWTAPPLWVGADSADAERRDYRIRPELYCLDAVAYESLIVGLFTIWRGEMTNREKPNEICVGFSRDGFHWWRPERRAFIAVSEHVGDWNWANVQSAGGCCLVVGDRLRFYVSGRSGRPGTSEPGVCSTGLATLRRDGFASMAVDEAGTVRRVSALGRGALVTRAVTFTGSRLFVNADPAGGELRVAIEDRGGRPVPGLTMAECRPIQRETTAAEVTWTSGKRLDRVAGTPVRLRFELTAGRLYSFWVSATADGASRGYVAAGGPRFTGPADTVGVAPGG